MVAFFGGDIHQVKVVSETFFCRDVVRSAQPHSNIPRLGRGIFGLSESYGQTNINSE